MAVLLKSRSAGQRSIGRFFGLRNLTRKANGSGRRGPGGIDAAGRVGKIACNDRNAGAGNSGDFAHTVTPHGSARFYRVGNGKGAVAHPTSSRHALAKTI